MKSAFTFTFTTKYLIFFVCPITKKVMKSGPKGKVRNPILLMTLKLCAVVAAAAYGVPLPIPALPVGMSTQGIVDSMTEEIGSIVEEKLDSNSSIMSYEEH
jgi:hypothetical protein